MSAAIWCAGLKTVSPGLCTEGEVFKALAAFNASEAMFVIQRQESAHRCEDVDILDLWMGSKREVPSGASAWGRYASESTMDTYITNGIARGDLVITE